MESRGADHWQRIRRRTSSAKLSAANNGAARAINHHSDRADHIGRTSPSNASCAARQAGHFGKASHTVANAPQRNVSAFRT